MDGKEDGLNGDLLLLLLLLRRNSSLIWLLSSHRYSLRCIKGDHIPEFLEFFFWLFGFSRAKELTVIRATQDISDQHLHLH